MTITELDLSLTTGVQTLTAAAGSKFVPQSVSYVQFVNPSASASFAYAMPGSTPAVNGIGVTVGPLGSSTVSCPPGVVFPLSSVSIIGTTTSAATVFWS